MHFNNIIKKKGGGYTLYFRKQVTCCRYLFTCLVQFRPLVMCAKVLEKWTHIMPLSVLVSLLASTFGDMNLPLNGYISQRTSQIGVGECFAKLFLPPNWAKRMGRESKIRIGPNVAEDLGFHTLKSMGYTIKKYMSNKQFIIHFYQLFCQPGSTSSKHFNNVSLYIITLYTYIVPFIQRSQNTLQTWINPQNSPVRWVSNIILPAYTDRETEVHGGYVTCQSSHSESGSKSGIQASFLTLRSVLYFLWSMWRPSSFDTPDVESTSFSNTFIVIIECLLTAVPHKHYSALSKFIITVKLFSSAMLIPRI